MSTSNNSNFDHLPKQSAVAIAISMALTGQSGTVQAQEAGAGDVLEEIIVTSRKREESMQDVAASIQAFTGEDLKRQGLQNMEDVIRFLPSVSAIGGTAGANKIIFRGVSDSPVTFIADSSAALYIDEQPLTQFAINPEPRMVDIERVEALSGPQGTLYGDASQSGTLRIITNKPDPTGFEGLVDLMAMSGDESEESYDISGVLNIPLVEDKFAVRLVGFTAHDGGFVDNVLGVSPMQGTKDNSALVGEDINGVDTTGGRVSAKWFINDNWAATGAYVYQDTQADGWNDYDPTVGDLQTVKFFQDRRDDTWWQAALTLEGTIGEIDIISSTSYFERDIDYVFDRTTYSAYFNYTFCVYYQFAYYCWSGNTFYDQDTVGFNTLLQTNDRFTQELRISRSAENYRWVIGAFYETKNEHWEYRAITPEFLTTLSYSAWLTYYAPSNVDPSWWLSSDTTEWEQWAVFGNFNYDFNETWSVEVGARYFDQTTDRLYFVDKPFIISPNWPDNSNQTGGGNADWVPKVSLTYRFDDDRLIYALYSEGFRAGGVNRARVPEMFTVFPNTYEPDKLNNYELGAKTRWAGGRVQLNATFFFMQWDNYQVEAIDPSFQSCAVRPPPECGQPFQVVVANLGEAEQTGVEADLRALAGDNLDLGLNFTYVDAKTTTTFDVTSTVPKGTQLPNVPEWKFSAYAQYSWPVNFVSGGEMYARLQHSYNGDSRSQLEIFPELPPLTYINLPTRIQPSYNITDLKFGIITDNWEVQAFVNNLSDERAELFNNVTFHDTFFGRSRVNTNRPREYGLRLSYRWGE